LTKKFEKKIIKTPDTNNYEIVIIIEFFKVIIVEYLQHWRPPQWRTE